MDYQLVHRSRPGSGNEPTRLIEWVAADGRCYEWYPDSDKVCDVDEAREELRKGAEYGTLMHSAGLMVGWAHPHMDPDKCLAIIETLHVDDDPSLEAERLALVARARAGVEAWRRAEATMQRNLAASRRGCTSMCLPLVALLLGIAASASGWS